MVDIDFVTYTIVGILIGHIIVMLFRKRWKSWVRERLEIVK